MRQPLVLGRFEEVLFNLDLELSEVEYYRQGKTQGKEVQNRWDFSVNSIGFLSCLFSLMK